MRHPIGAVSVLALSVAIAGPAVVSAEPQSGGTLRILWEDTPRHFNPAVQSGTPTGIPGTQIFASPLRYDDEWNPQPYLAQDWEVSDDGQTVTLHLREDAVFHDGEPITSEDVAFSVETVQEYHPFTTMFEPVASVDTPDEHTAVLNLDRPHPAILLAMSPALLPIIPEHIYGDGQAVDSHPRNVENPVGSGPFELAEFEPGEFVILERFDDYFIDGRPYLDRVILDTTSDTSNMILGIEAGDAEMIPILSSVRNIQRLDENAEVEVTARGYEAIGPLNWLAFNTKREPLDDARVRQAIAYAVDREFYVENLLGGVASIANTGVMPGTPFYNGEVETYEHNIERANALLDEAGYERGADGVRFELSIDYIPGYPDQQRAAAEMVRSQLRPIGIQVNVRPSPDFPTWADRVGGHDFDMTMDIVFNWGDPVIGVHRTYLSDNIREGVIWSNTQSYSNEAVDELLAEAATETDPDARKALYAEFQDLVANDVPIYFMNTVPYHTAFRSDAVGNPPTTIWGPLSPLDEVYLKNAQ